MVRVCGLVALCTLLLAATGDGRQAPAPAGSTGAGVQAVRSLSVDVVALDRDGRPVDTLGPADFVVLVDGRPRRVTAVRHVSRGPGASESAALVASRADAIAAASEPVRNVLIVVDQSLMERGDEPATIRAGAALLDRLGLSDRVAIVRVPAPARAAITLTTDRPSAREDLRAVIGQIAGVHAGDEPARAVEPPRSDVDPTRAANAGDPDRAGGAEREQTQIAANEAAVPVSTEAQARIRDSLGGVRDVLGTLAAVPGRKVVVLITAGLPHGWNELIRETDLRSVAATAAAARAVVHVVGMKGTRADAQLAPELTAYESLARLTGGLFTLADKQADRVTARLMASLSSCYVLSIEAAASDGDGGRHQLRVESARKGVTLHAPSALVLSGEPDDFVVALPATLPAGVAPAAVPVVPPSESRERRAERDAELALVLSRAIDYVAGYQQAFSAVVAEEQYMQTAGTRRVGLMSDFLLVRPANSSAWVSFRDVFEVNGERVRDRDDRLKALFLDHPNVDESEQLEAIKSESARYNIGPVERNLNVPLYALRVLTTENRGRFRFTLGRRGDEGGVAVQRLEFLEVTRPTLVSDMLSSGDVPLGGWFDVDPLTGAITESMIEALNPNVTARFVVRYRRDPNLGLWVPQDMLETYLGPTGSKLVEAQASYSKLRRFQVKTEEKLTIRK